MTTLLWPYAKLALRQPRLLPALLHAGWRFRRRDWYRVAPFLPIPPIAYIEWRMHTAYGSAGGGPNGKDLARYLDWCRWMNRRSRHPESDA